MRRTITVVGVLASILATVLIGGCRLHGMNRERSLAQFEELELRTAEEIAALLESELTGAARTLRAFAVTLPATRDRALDELLRHSRGCEQLPCFTNLTVIDGDRLAPNAPSPPFDVPRDQLNAAAAWARSDAHAGDIRTIITSPRGPSLILLTPVLGGPGHRELLGGEITLDALFTAQKRQPGPQWPSLATLVLKRDGTVVFHSEHPEMRLNNVYGRTARCFTCHTSFDYVERMLATDRGIVRYRLRGVDQIAAVAPLTFEGERWMVAVRVRSDQVVGPLSSELRQIVGLAGVVVVLVVAAAVMTWRDGRRRIRAESESQLRSWLEARHDELTALNKKLERAAHEWRTTVDTIDAALIVLDPAGTIRRMNLAAAATLPDALPSWLGRPTARLAEHEPWNAALALLDEAVASHAVVARRVVDRHGRSWDLWIRALPDPHQASVIVLARDVTDVIELQESVRRSETMAQLGAIVSGVAHEVRNPLFGISSLVDAWAVQPHRDPTPFVDALRGEVGRLRSLMVDLLEYGRPPKSTRQAQPIAGVLKTALSACTLEAAQRHVKVTLTDGTGAHVLMDARRLERVFVNLIQNAIQHAPAESTIRVETTPTPDAAQILVTVRDTGPGIAPEDLAHVFTPFFSRRSGGVGLGLAITERIVTEHAGTVVAANDPAGGAVMTVRLPVCGQNAGACDREVPC